ncbi:hypothetical protein ACFLRF_03405 [Candidatus Altiarchaeota archaeon]
MSYLRIGKAVVSITHDDDDVLSSKIITELAAHQVGEGQANARITISNSISSKIPEKAVRTTSFEYKDIYTLDGRKYVYREDEYMICIDPQEMSLNIEYNAFSEGLCTICRHIIKWMMIKANEDQGIPYIHGSAIQHNGKNILFTGDSNTGKTTSLIRSVNNGGKAITDDTVFIDGDRLHPFSFKPTIDEDIMERFSEKGSILEEMMECMDCKTVYEGIDVIIFLRIWNYDKDSIRKMEGIESISRLFGIYKKECKLSIWHEKIDNRFIFEEYDRILQDTKCIEFTQGYDEEEVKKDLLEILDED